ncbi:hypothetical protein V8F33_001030 [Rhypophila sp. PSN 637]
MCDFKQRDYACGHRRWLAFRHCAEYIRTRRRNCATNVLEFEERPNDICGECKSCQQLSRAPWMSSFMSGLKLHH